MTFTVTNVSEHVVRGSGGHLPWSTRYSAMLAAVPLSGSGTALRQPFPMEDEKHEDISIEPGEQISGRVDLLRRFDGFQHARAEGDVYLLWVYEFRMYDPAQVLPPFFGVIRIPKM